MIPTSMIRARVVAGVCHSTDASLIVRFVVRWAKLCIDMTGTPLGSGEYDGARRARRGACGVGKWVCCQEGHRELGPEKSTMAPQLRFSRQANQVVALVLG